MGESEHIHRVGPCAERPYDNSRRLEAVVKSHRHLEAGPKLYRDNGTSIDLDEPFDTNPKT